MRTGIRLITFSDKPSQVTNPTAVYAVEHLGPETTLTENLKVVFTPVKTVRAEISMEVERDTLDEALDKLADNLWRVSEAIKNRNKNSPTLPL
jgi:hypothetical protein